jgi:hypothetical protein
VQIRTIKSIKFDASSDRKRAPLSAPCRTRCRMHRDASLQSPHADAGPVPWYLLPIWLLVFWRIQRLKAWFRAAGGPGSQMLWGVMWNGRVVVIQLSDDLSGHRPGCFRAPVSGRLRLALVAAPSPCPRRTPGLRRDQPSHCDCAAAGAGRVRIGPIPDTCPLPTPNHIRTHPQAPSQAQAQKNRKAKRHPVFQSARNAGSPSRRSGQP